MSVEDFFNTFLQNDQTVIMLTTQNNHTKPFPTYIEINNPNAELFPNGALVSWKHRKKERDYLRQLHAALFQEAKDAQQAVPGDGLASLGRA